MYLEKSKELKSQAQKNFSNFILNGFPIIFAKSAFKTRRHYTKRKE